MNDEEFMAILDQLKTYIDRQNTFVENPFRMNEFTKAIKKANELFPEAKITIKDDPLQMGAMILNIEDYDLDITETDYFADLIKSADNWEIYSLPNGNVCLAAVFQHALVKIS